MSRFLMCGLAAFALTGCLDCVDGDYYDCVVRYDPYYGYYNDCHLVRNRCPEPSGYRCKGGNCGCTADYQCEPGDVCNSSGQCVRNSASSGGGSSESPDASMSSGARTGAGGASGSDVDGGDAPGSGSHSGSGSASGSGSSSGAGAHSGAGGHSAAGGSSAHAGSTAAGGSATGSGGTTSVGGHANSGGSAASGTGATSSAGGSGASGGRIPRLDFACVRDTQCGAGQCTSGECYIACESDTDCGTADRCSVETGRRLCMPDPNPPVRCDESAICRPEQTCVNGACHDPCSTDGDCKNLEDRCTENLCFPDRRPIAECVLNVECPPDLVCLDGRCVHFGGD